MHSPTSKFTFTLLLSLAVHSLLLIPGESSKPNLAQHSIIHARLDKQDRELIQQQQVGQLSQQHNEQISDASQPTLVAEDQPLKQQATKSAPSHQAQPLLTTQSEADKKSNTDPIEDIPEKNNTEAEIEEIVEKTEVVASQAQHQQVSQINSDSRAQVEAFEGSEDPTYSSYRRVLRQYLSQRLEAKAEFNGSVRLKIKLEYGSIATHVSIIQSSGNLALDDWAKKAALAANPYPKIPKEIGSSFEYSPTFQLGQTEL